MKTEKITKLKLTDNSIISSANSNNNMFLRFTKKPMRPIKNKKTLTIKKKFKFITI
jgi:hypothetical protein